MINGHFPANHEMKEHIVIYLGRTVDLTGIEHKVVKSNESRIVVRMPFRGPNWCLFESRVSEVARVGKSNFEAFSYWHIERTYLNGEQFLGQFCELEPVRIFMNAAVDDVCIEDDRDVCPECGFGRKAASPFYIKYKHLKNHIVIPWGRTVLFSRQAVEAITAASESAIQFRPCFDGKNAYLDSLNSFLRAKGQDAHRSKDNLLTQIPAEIADSILGHRDDCLLTREHVLSSDFQWFEPLPRSSVARISGATLVCDDPFCWGHKTACNLGHSVGYHRIGLVNLDWIGTPTDYFCTDNVFGYAPGLFWPSPARIVSSRIARQLDGLGAKSVVFNPIL